MSLLAWIVLILLFMMYVGSKSLAIGRTNFPAVVHGVLYGLCIWRAWLVGLAILMAFEHFIFPLLIVLTRSHFDEAERDKWRLDEMARPSYLYARMLGGGITGLLQIGAYFLVQTIR